MQTTVIQSTRTRSICEAASSVFPKYAWENVNCSAALSYASYLERSSDKSGLLSYVRCTCRHPVYDVALSSSFAERCLARRRYEGRVPSPKRLADAVGNENKMVERPHTSCDAVRSREFPNTKPTHKHRVKLSQK